MCYFLISQSYHDLVTQAFVQWQEDMKAYQAVSIKLFKYKKKINNNK
jgi:hypothetical protein